MKFSVKQRDGPGRVGQLLTNDKKVSTPNILFLDTSRFKAPRFSEITLTKEIEKNSKIVSEDDNLSEVEENIIIVKYASQLLNQSKKFVNFIVELREKIGYQKAIYLPGVGNPTNMALLVYLGVDLFDSTSAIVAARNNQFFFENEIIQKENLKEIFCNCPRCSKKQSPKDLEYEDILNHNYYAIFSKVKQIRNTIENGNLRNLVETQIRIDPESAALLKNLDQNHYDYLERRTPVASKSKLIASSKESMNRAEILRFQERVISRYKKPESAKILLLLPCSARKPYFLSKTHKFFRNTIQSIDNPNIVHELIITSPLGLVPRELELTYPAANYDIPVTGVWEDYEKEMIKSLLSKYIKNNKYEKIIAHLPEELTNFIKPLVKTATVTCIDKPASDKSLEKLKQTLEKASSDYKKVKYIDKVKEEIMSLASYQFGKKNAQELLKNSTIKGKYPYRKIFEANKQLGMITQDRGLISLTLDGAKKIKDYSVKIYDDFQLKGSVFAPGIIDADEKIRINDEVIVKSKNKIVAIGVSQMTAEEMKKSDYGKAVKVRHKI